MQVLLFLIVLCLGGFLYHGAVSWHPERWLQAALSQPAAASNVKQVVPVEMYALTTCSHCRNMERKMKAARIRFIRYDIDADPARLQELNQRMINAGYQPRGGVPMIFIGNHVFSGEIPIQTIESLIY